jgi:hypothetical protein
MKKKLYCRYCKNEFEKEIKSMNDIKNITCPNCNKQVNDKDRKPEIVTNKDKKIESIAYTLINIYFYFYFVTSSLSLIFYFTHYIKLFEITTIITIIGIIIDYLLGYTRNLFGTLGLLISSILGVYILKDTKLGIFLGITVCTFISSFIKVIINKLLNRLFRKYG